MEIDLPGPDGLLHIHDLTAPKVRPATRKAGSDFTPPRGPLPKYHPPLGLTSFRDLDMIALDIETKDPQLRTEGPGARRFVNGKRDGFIVGVAVAYDEANGTYYPVAHANRDRCIANPAAFWRDFKEEARAYRGVITGANLQYDLDWLDAEQGITFPRAKINDVQVAEPLLDENKLTYKLNFLANEYLGEGKATDVLRDLYGPDYISNMDRVDPAHAETYAVRDCTLAWEILKIQLVALAEQELLDLFDLESRLMPLLLQMRRVGVPIDLSAANNAVLRLAEMRDEALDKLAAVAGFKVKIWEAASIARAFDKVGVEYPMTAKTEKPSFKKGWLEACPHDMAREIVAARELDKVKGTFIESYIIGGHTNGRIHTSFHQLKGDDGGTVSGRFSSSNPNLQNIPARHEILGPLCRSMFVPEDDHDWGCIDWSQIEYRFLVHYANRTKGVDASRAVAMYRNDPSTDFHALAAELTGVPRKQAKNINFGVVYGMGVPLLAASLNVPLREAEEILKRFHTRAPFMREMLQIAGARASATGMIKTILGRRRRFDAWEVRMRHGIEMFHNEEAARKFQERNGGRIQRAKTHKALNGLLQGSAADLMKKAMVEMFEAGVFDIIVPHLTVHDEMDVSVPKTREGASAWAEMEHIMTTTLELDVPILASKKLGTNWDDAK